MYFNNCNKINISDLINSAYLIYAHKKDLKYEPLENHINLCIKYFYKIIEEKNLDDIFKKIESNYFNSISSEVIELFKEMIVSTISLHDVGKINPYFQKKRLNNDLNIKECEKYKNSNHSTLSSVIFIDTYFPKIKEFEKKERNLLLDFMMLNSYVISRHHSGFNTWDDFKKKFESDGEGENILGEQRLLYEKTLDNNIAINSKIIKKIFKIIDTNSSTDNKEKIVYRYIYERLMLSLLIACDFYSTSEFMDEVEISDIGTLDDIEEFYDAFKEGSIYKSIRNYEEKQYNKEKDFSNIKDINILRNEMFLDAERELINNRDSSVFYLEAPTGSGKSNVATNLSFKLLQEDKSKNKIFYVYPFNTLVEQNINTLNKVFEKETNILNKIAVINSVEPIKLDHKYDNVEDSNISYYKKALIDRQFLNYPMILTTHVTFFKYLFGVSKEDVFPLHQIANSVIILDEIQSYKNLIWSEIITFLTCYANVLNMKIIIMSATLPDLDMLSLSRTNTVKLIKNRDKYFENPIFKNRVRVDYSLLKSENIKDDLYEHVKKQSFLGEKILIEFISKNSAYDFYNLLKDDEEIICDVELMSGDDNIAERNRIIKKVKSSSSLILVATQVIEAGVDIDMDIGYKNISALDSEEQFIGRINRSCKKDKSIVYFFKIDEAKKIYKDDVRINKDLTLEDNTMRIIYEEKKFGEYYKLVIDRLKNLTSGFSELNIENFFNADVKKLDFENVENKLRLISNDKNKISVYLSSNLIIKKQALNGTDLWYEYKVLLHNKTLDYAERRVKLSQITSKMNNFIYEIKWNYDFPYNDRLGELYFIEEGENYFKDGKLDKEKFKDGIGDFI